MKDFQVILRNEFVINQRGNKEFKIDNNRRIEKLIKEGYLVKSIHTENNTFQDSSYFQESGYPGQRIPSKKIYFVEIYILQLHQNL